MSISRNMYKSCKWNTLHVLALLLEHTFGNTVDVISLPAVCTVFSGDFKVSPRCFCGICVCSTERFHKLDRMVYWLVVMFFRDSAVRHTDITDNCLIEYVSVSAALSCVVQQGMFPHFLFQCRQIPTVLLYGDLGYIFVSRTCSNVFPHSFRHLQFFFLSMWPNITSLQKLIQSQAVNFHNCNYFLIYFAGNFVGPW
jgi:hypothetical protein